MIHEKLTIAPEGCPEAQLFTYFWEESKELYPGQKRPVILICPGGGYEMTSDREAEAIALRFLSMGYHTAVLRYSVAPNRYPIQLLQTAECVRLLRQNADKWLICPDKVLVMGFSAGGHLAGSLGVLYKRPEIWQPLHVTPKEIRPDGMILCYPVISSGPCAHCGSFRNLLGERYEEDKEKMSLELYVDKDTPPAFLWHSFADDSVPVENSLLFVCAMKKAKVPVEFHMYPEGIHGTGLANELTASYDGTGIERTCQTWSDLAGKWLNRFYPWWQIKR